jgi:mono/diheme cytochrome c family protein/uncharacterized membrane protein
MELMLIRRGFFDAPFVLGSLWILLSLEGQHLRAQTVTQTENGTAAARELFRKHCVKCHGSDGTGSPSRSSEPDIPDFTAPTWQARQTEDNLVTSILDGKGKEMPPFRDKIKKDLARELAVYVRAFAPIAGKPEKEQGGNARGAFEKEFRRLQEERDQLKQLREQSRESPDKKSPKPATSSPPSPATKPASKSADESAAQMTSDYGLFRQHCGKCHGTDGTGSRMRSRKPDIPNFTDSTWQARYSDAQLLKSILDGKGKKMPSFREKLNEDQARSLLASVRAFAPSKGTAEDATQASSSGRYPSPEEEPEEHAPAPIEEGEPPAGFFGKLIRWLGNFHPASVHFPLGLLTAAAIAELLRLVTQKPAFDAVSRYCVWFGALTAAGAAILGWCLGGFHLTDSTWVMMSHRWCGTALAALAGLVLLLSELSYRSERRHTRIVFRVTLLVVAGLVSVTGYLGGGLVYGLDHYTWPQ